MQVDSSWTEATRTWLLCPFWNDKGRKPSPASHDTGKKIVESFSRQTRLLRMIKARIGSSTFYRHIVAIYLVSLILKHIIV
jgi:hypothetical protein